MNEATKPKQKMETLDLQTISGRLAFITKEAGITDRKIRSTMAKICKVSPQAIHRWFDGNTHSPSAENIAALARHYEADLMWLITGDCVLDPDSDKTPVYDLKSKLKNFLPAGVELQKVKQIKITLSSIEIHTVFEGNGVL